MNQLITTTLFLLLSFTAFSQIKFEKGYFIDNNGTKIECLIKNMDWKNNPNEIIYKLNETSLKSSFSTENILEFGVYQYSKYEKHTVDIDISSQNIQHMDKTRNPIWERQTLLLKVLVEGNAVLYKYTNNDYGYKYFYKKDASPVKQLIYKNYITKESKKAENLSYINQLYKEVNCKKLLIDKIKKVNYDQKSLSNYFEKNNLCENTDTENIQNHAKKKGKLNFKITPGINFTSLSIANHLDKYNDPYEFNSEVVLRVGMEFEFIFPFNKNKWSIFIDPNFFSYSSNLTKELNSGFLTMKNFLNTDANIKRFAIPIGTRHYFFLNDDIKIFVNAGVRYDLDLGSSIGFDTRSDLELESSMFNFFVGTGVNLNNKYSTEIRFFSPDYLNKYVYWSSDYQTISFILGYKF